MSGRTFVAICVPALLAAAAIGHATGGASAGGPALVTVEARGARTATGFIVRDERVVTVAHAVGTGLVHVRGADGVARQATVLRRDQALDLAVLMVPGLPAAPRMLARGATHVLLRRGGAQVSARAVVRRRLDARVRTGDGRVIARRPALELTAPIRCGRLRRPADRRRRPCGRDRLRPLARAGRRRVRDRRVGPGAPAAVGDRRRGGSRGERSLERGQPLAVAVEDRRAPSSPTGRADAARARGSRARASRSAPPRSSCARRPSSARPARPRARAPSPTASGCGPARPTTAGTSTTARASSTGRLERFAVLRIRTARVLSAIASSTAIASAS